MNRINWITFLLAWVAGFCDTATFVAGDSIFSAHVTGNFIVFAAQIISDSTGMESWVKLLTFPVFVTAVMTGGWLVERSGNKYSLLSIEGIILIICGIMAMLSPMLNAIDKNVWGYVIVMIAVFAMGLQNAFGKLFAKETLGPTTMMTGNVTQASLDMGQLIWKRAAGSETAWTSLQKQLILIGGFLAGCIAGALLAKWIGLSAIAIPGLCTVVCYVAKKNRHLTLNNNK